MSSCGDVPAKLSVRRSDVDPELEDVVARCLEKDANNRPTAEEVAKRLMPGAGALLEWPPPGLEELHGRMRHISIMFMLGGASLALVMFALLAAGPRLSSIVASPVTMLLVIAAVAGVIALGVAVSRALRASVLAARVIRNGYAWMTVLETLCDMRGDTGNIIAGSREYAGIKPAQRDIYRKGRVGTELALLAGGLVAPMLFLFAVVLGSSGIVGLPIAWIALLAPAAGIAAAVLFAERERRAFAAHRKRRVTGADLARLASPWNETFEVVRRGQRIGRGPATRPDAGRWSTIGAATLLVLVVLLLVPLAVVGTLGPSYWSRTIPKFSNTKEKARIASIMRPFVLPKDARIKPLVAGHAFYALHAAKPLPGPGFVENPITLEAPPPWDKPVPPGIFADVRWQTTENLPSGLKIISAMRSPRSAAEMAYLRNVATAPQWKHWDLLARASRLDYLGARYKVPFGDSATSWGMPMPSYGTTKMLAYASISRAAYHMAAGRRDSAEFALRGAVSVGFLMVDEGNTLMEQLIGIVITSIARQGLIDFYKAIGDPRGALLQARLDSIVAQVEAAPLPASSGFAAGLDLRDAAVMRSATMQLASDRGETRSLRLELMHPLALAPCTNLRELVFGFDPDLRALFDHQKASLGRYASDTAVIELIERQAEMLDEEEIGFQRNPFIKGSSRAAGAILRNKRLAGCVALLTAYN
jgi:hypothetical protein